MNLTKFLVEVRGNWSMHLNWTKSEHSSTTNFIGIHNFIGTHNFIGILNFIGIHNFIVILNFIGIHNFKE
jgi:hypothetical protein